MATQTITPSTTFVTIDSLQSPFTTVVLSTIGFQGQTVTVLDRTASASIANPIIISSVTGASTIIDQRSGFVTIQAQVNGSSWSYLNTFPFWNQQISSGVSVLTTSTLYTNINSTVVETLDTMTVENIVITGRFPPTESATFIQTMTVTEHAEIVSSFRANGVFTISSYLSTFSTLHLASSLTVGGPIIIQSTLTALSSFFVSSVVTATSLSTGLLTVGGSLLLSSIDLQQSTGTTLTIGGNLAVQKGLTVLSSVTTGNSVTANSLFVGSSLSTVTMAVGSNLLLSTNISTGSLFQNDSLTVAGLTNFYGTTTVVSSMNVYSANMKHSLSLDNSLNVSTVSIQALRVVGTLSNVGQTSVSTQVSTFQNLNTGAFVASSTQLAVQGSFSTIGSLYDMAGMTLASSIQIQGSVSTPSTLNVGGNSLFRGPVQVNGNIAFTSSLTILSSLNVLNTLSINTLLTRFSTTIIGNLNAASTVTVSGIAWLSSYSLPSAATVNQINVVSSLIAQGVLSTATTASPLIPLYTSSLGIGYASTPYSVQLPYMISSQSVLVSSLSTMKVASYGSTWISTTMAIGMSSLGPGLDVAGLAKVNGSLYAFQTISSQKTYASSITGFFYGNALGLSNFGLQSSISTSRLFISSLSTMNTSTNLFMGSSGSMVASLTLASTLYFQDNPFLQSQSTATTKSSATNQIQSYSHGLLQLNNSIFISSGFVGVNTSTPKYSLHIEKTLGVGGIAGASFEYRSVRYDTLVMSTLIDGTNAFINSGLIEMSNLLIDSTIDNNTYYVTTLAGSGSTDFKDGQGIAASFNQPLGIAVDSAFNVYVSDTFNHSIRKITPSGLVTTIAGNGNLGYSDGTGLDARFNSPTGITIDPLSNLYVADYKNNRIRKVTPAGVVTTLAGSGIPAFLDGQGQAASFYWPSGITIDSAGNLYVADSANNRIRKIDTALNVTTIAGNASATYTDGIGITASFNSPYSITIDNSNNLYVGDQMNYRIRKIDSGANVTTIVGNGTPGYLDGNGTSAQVSYVNGLYYDRSILYFTDAYNNTIRSYSPSGAVSTIGGNGIPGFLGNTNGVGLSSRFNMPSGIAIDSTGTLYIDDQSNNTVRKMIPKYQVHSNTNRIQAIQSTLNVNNFMYIGQSTVGIGVSSPSYTLQSYSIGSVSNFTTYTTEVNATTQVNPNEKSIWVATGYTDYATESNMRYSLDNGTTWLSGNDQQLWNLTKGAAYNGSYWVSPGSPIMTSTDGSNWNSVVDQGGSGSFLTGGGKVAWNGFYWIATGPSSNRQGTLLKSQDGLNWTAAATGGFTTGSVYQGSDILWTGSQWIATGSAPTTVSSIQWSKDGVNWSSITTGGFLTGGNGLSFGPRIPYARGFEQYQGNPLLLAVGNDPSISSIQYSYDGGFNWSTINSGGFTTNANGIDTDGKYLIAVGKDANNTSNIQIGTIQTNPFSFNFMSYDNYTSTSMISFTNNANCVKWNGSTWLLGGNNGVRQIIPTSNSYFSSITIGGISNYTYMITIEKSQLTISYYTLNSGSTWLGGNPLQAGFVNNKIESNGSNMWVMVGNSSPATWYSTDGQIWNQITNIPFSYPTQTCSDLRFLNNRWFIAANDTGNHSSTIMTSVDGKNWSNIPGTPSVSGVGTILYGNGLYVAAAITGGADIPYYSYDLTTWTAGSGVSIGLYGSVGAYGNGVFILAGFSQYGNGSSYDPTLGSRPVIRSTDGINWTYVYATAFRPEFKYAWYLPLVIAFSPTVNRFVMGGTPLGYVNAVYTSDGITWANTSGLSGSYYFAYDGISWNGSAFVANPLADGGSTFNPSSPLYYSTDGITFTTGNRISPTRSYYGALNTRGFVTTTSIDQTEYTSFAYSSNPSPLLNTSSFSVFADTDINTIHSQTTNNTMHVTSNSIIFNDLFTVTDKIVNFGSYPLDPSIISQSSLSIFQNIEITGYFSTGSASVSSLYLGIQSV